MALRDALVAAERQQQWSKGARADADHVVEWRVELKQSASALEWLDETFWAVSEPASPRYGQHVTVEDIAEQFSASDEELEAITLWMSSTGASDVRVGPTGDYVFAKSTVAALERWMGVEMHQYQHKTSKKATTVRAAKLHVDLVPSHLSHIVERVVGITDLPVLGRKVTSPDFKGINVTPPVIYAAYGFPAEGETFTSAQAAQSVAEFEQAYFYPSDLNMFEKKFGLAVTNLTRIVGKNDPNTGYLGECSLDVEYVQVTGRNIDTWMFSQSQFDMTTWAQTVLATPGAPLIHSVSWGSGEGGYQSSQLTSANTEFQKMGALGMTLFMASGDVGTGSTGFLSCGKFTPTYPASSPYVTAVGGTVMPSTTAPEYGWSLSGGGFSAFFKQPSYQNASVAKFLKTSTLPAQQYWTAGGRGIPDVSAVATNFQVIISQYLGPLSGTSAATPTWAGTIATMNGLRAKAGKKPLGFLNPVLYGLNSVGTDIVAGNNKVTFCPAGFEAVAGWDAITGLGTPIYSTLQKGLVADTP